MAVAGCFLELVYSEGTLLTNFSCYQVSVIKIMTMGNGQTPTVMALGWMDPSIRIHLMAPSVRPPASHHHKFVCHTHSSVHLP